MRGIIKDITGQRFGRLTVIENVGRDKHRQVIWRCKCDCGKETIIRGYSLRSGNTQSCGCLQDEVREKTHRTHGGVRTRLYTIWGGMKTRCLSPNEPCYQYYGGRGIKVCNEWLSFDAFREWALSHGYRDDLTLDRINVDGNYEPSNCRWLTIQEQQSNKRSNRVIEFNGESHTLQEWANLIGISHATLIERIERWGSIQEALTIPKGGKQRWR